MQLEVFFGGRSHGHPGLVKQRHKKNVLKTTMTETRFFEPARLSIPPKPLFSVKPLNANLVEVIVT